VIMDVVTPPFNISARPVLTLNVPRSAIDPNINGHLLRFASGGGR
jgi:hypothetical protein